MTLDHAAINVGVDFRRYRADGTAPIQNKVGAFLADPLLDRILTAPEKDLHTVGAAASSSVVAEARD
jgi:hypothetical protein